jgi:hypothetical protein
MTEMRREARRAWTELFDDALQSVETACAKAIETSCRAA